MKSIKKVYSFRKYYEDIVEKKPLEKI